MRLFVWCLAGTPACYLKWDQACFPTACLASASRQGRQQRRLSPSLWCPGDPIGPRRAKEIWPAAWSQRSPNPVQGAKFFRWRKEETEWTAKGQSCWWCCKIWKVKIWAWCWSIKDVCRCESKTDDENSVFAQAIASRAAFSSDQQRLFTGSAGSFAEVDGWYWRDPTKRL